MDDEASSLSKFSPEKESAALETLSGELTLSMPLRLQHYAGMY
jgi:hypothetical protein